MTDKVQQEQQGGVVKKSDVVHSFALKLLARIKEEYEKHEPRTPNDLSHNIKVVLLFNLLEQLKKVFGSPTNTCAFVHEFLLPHWKITLVGPENVRSFDSKSIQDSQEEEIKKIARQIITETTTTSAEDILTPGFINKCKEELSFIFRYFEAMCDAYTIQKS